MFKLILYPILSIVLIFTYLNSKTQTKQENLPQKSFVTNSVQYLTSPETTSLNLPFSEAVRIDNILYLSGQIGNIPGQKKLTNGGIKAETKQTMENIKRVLEIIHQ